LQYHLKKLGIWYSDPRIISIILVGVALPLQILMNDARIAIVKTQPKSRSPARKRIVAL